MTQVFLAVDFLGILKEVMQWIFTLTLGPVVTALLNWAWLEFKSWIVDLVFSGLLWIFTFLLRLVSLLDQMMTLFSGLGTYQLNGVNQNENLMEYLFKQNGITTALYLMTLLGISLAFLFAAYSTGKSISDSALAPDYKPVSRVLGDGLKAAMTFVMTPFLCLLIIQLSSMVLTQISISTTEVILEQNQELYADVGTSLSEVQGSNPGVADIMFMVSTQGAIRSKSGAAAMYSEKNSFQDMDRVKRVFDYTKINYLTGYLLSTFVLVILALSSLAFIQRMFEILVLYLVSPLFTATIPLDGGAKFRRWREMFVGRMVSAFGPIFTMKLFLIIMPLLVTSRIRMHPTSDVKDYLLKALMVCGGIYSIYKGKNMVIEIFSPESAASIERGENLTKRAALWSSMKAKQKASQAKQKITQKLGGDGQGGGGGQGFRG